MGGIVNAVGNLFSGGSSGPATPATPDYRGAAEATAQSNKEAATANTWANRPTINTPWGQQSWQASAGTDPATGQAVTNWTQNTNLTPDAQKALNSQMAMQNGRSDIALNLMPHAGAAISTPIDYSKVSQWGQGYTGPGVNTNYQMSAMNNANKMQTTGVGGSGMYRPVADSMYQQATSRLDPRFQQGQSDLDSKLASQGISRNSNAYNRAQNNFAFQKNDAYNQAMNSATQGGITAAGALQGMDVSQMNAQNAALMNQQNMSQSAGTFGNTAINNANTAQQQAYQQAIGQSNYQNTLRQAQVGEQVQNQNNMLNNMNALMNGQQVSMPNMPSFNSATQYGGVNYTGAAQNQAAFNQDQANATNAYNNNNQQGAMGLLGTGLQAASMFGFSDRRLKRDIRKVGTMHMGKLNVYEFRYLGSQTKEIGVMADEVAKVYPDAVKKADSGYLMVNYSKLLGA